MKKRLGELLVEEGFINELQLAVALGEQRKWGGKLGATIIRQGFVRETDMAYALSKHLGIDWVTLKDNEICETAKALINASIAKRYNVVPIKVEDNTLTIATSDPTDLRIIDVLRFATGKRIQTVIAPESDIMLAIARHYDNAYVDESAYEDLILSNRFRKKTGLFTDNGSDGNGRRGRLEMLEKTLEKLVDILDKKNIISRAELKKLMEE